MSSPIATHDTNVRLLQTINDKCVTIAKCFTKYKTAYETIETHLDRSSQMIIFICEARHENLLIFYCRVSVRCFCFFWCVDVLMCAYKRSLFRYKFNRSCIASMQTKCRPGHWTTIEKHNQLINLMRGMCSGKLTWPNLKWTTHTKYAKYSQEFNSVVLRTEIRWSQF